MDRNFLLAIALSFLVLLLWSVLRGPPPAPPEEADAPVAEAPGAPATGVAPQPGPPAAPSPAPAPREPFATPAPAPAAPAQPEERVALESDLWQAVLTTRGGALARWELKEYRDASRDGHPHVELTTLSDEWPVALGTPFEELGLGDLSGADWRMERPDPWTVVFTHEQDGIRLRKTYALDPDRYVFRLRLSVENASDRTLRPAFLVRWPAVHRESVDFQGFWLSAYSDGDLVQEAVAGAPGFLGFGGGALEEPRTYPEERPAELDWAGAQMRYFLAALIPDVPREAAARFTPLPRPEAALADVAFNPIDVPAGQRAEREYRVYLGPKVPDRLDEVGAHLGEAIQRGWFPALTRFFTWLLTATHDIIPNYGVAIILITLIVRLLMFPVMARQMRSMKRLSTLQPKIKAVQEKYPDDRQKQSEAMMAVYREAGMSPFSAMAGCFPMLLQLPVFIGFYYALQGSIQLRQQPFFGWIQDLSEPEALFVIPEIDLPVRLLPLLMGGSMVLQQKLTPTTMDPAQARMMLTVMPVMFTVLFYQFASGLVLYWLVSNLLGILQQVLTNRSKDT